MHHELTMRYLAEQRSEQLITQAERDNRAAELRPVRSGAVPRLGGRLARRMSALARAGPGPGTLGRRLGV